MTPAEWARAKEVFGLALDLDPEARESFVRQSCEDDVRLCQQILTMLGRNDALRSFLESGPAQTTERLAPAAAPMRMFAGNARFEIRRCLGSGGFGSVYEAFDRERGMVVALKTLQRPDAANLLMFKREFRTLATFAHPNLVELYEFLNDGPFWFFTMELVAGSDFLGYVGRPSGDAGRLRAALAQLTDAVSYVHGQGKLHLDIKPSNIRVTPEGVVKLLDFGLVRDVAGESTYRTQAFGGTAAYMSPEQGTAAALTEASDWYSVGVVLCEALTGRVPFEGPFLETLWAKRQAPARAPRELAPGIPADLNDLCVGLLRREPGDRPPLATIRRSLAAAPLQPALPSAPLVGRSRHLDALRQALDAVRGGTTVCVHVQGQSGMGKSALCQQFLSRARTGGDVLILSGRCYESESVPFKALDPIVDALGQYLKRLAPSEAAAFLPRERPLLALARVFPTTLQVESIAKMRGELLEDSSPRDLQKLAIAALKEILARLAEKMPCIVNIDDMQWGDLDSVECLTSILAPPDPPRVLFLFSYRIEDVGTTPHLQRLLAQQRQEQRGHSLVELEVGRLSETESLELYQTLTGRRDPSIGHETEGMPLFIRELAMHAGARRDAASLQQMIQSRIRELPVPARRMVEMLSIAAQPIEAGSVRDAARLADGEYPARNLLLAANLIRVRKKYGREELEPYHDKIREAAVGLIDEEARRKHFESLALTLESKEDSDPEVLHRYFLAAGDLEKAQSWIEIAAGRAERALAFDLAVRLRERRLEMCASDDPDRLNQLERLADALSSAGRGVRAARAYQDAARGRDAGDHLDLIRKAGEQYVRSGHFEEGRALLLGLLQRAGFRIPSNRWQALAELMARRLVLKVRGLEFKTKAPEQISRKAAAELDVCRVASLAMALQDPIRAAELQTRHLLLSLELGEPYRIANSLAMEAGFRAARGGAARYAECCQLLDKVQELAAQSNHPNGISLAVSVRSKVAWFAGEWAESVRCGEEVHRMATEQLTRVAWEVYPSTVFWNHSLACMGRWREVLELLPGLMADSEARGDLLEVTNLPIVTFAYFRWLMADQPGRARVELESARERLNDPGFIPQRFGVWSGLTDVALYEGDAEAAWHAVTEGWKQLDESQFLRIQTIRIVMLHLRARAACAMAAAAGEPAKRDWFLTEANRVARRIRREKTAWGSAIGDLIEAGVTAQRRGRVAAAGRLEMAEQSLTRAGMHHLAAAAAYRRNPDADGRARAWFDAQKLTRPDRIIDMLCPENLSHPPRG